MSLDQCKKKKKIYGASKKLVTCKQLGLRSPYHVNDFENSKEFLCALLYNLFSNHVYRTGNVGFSACALVPIVLDCSAHLGVCTGSIFRASNQDMVRTKSPSLLTDKTHFHGKRKKREQKKKIFLEKFHS